MKSYKEFISESKTDSGEDNRWAPIHSICKKYRITDYTINADGSIDVDGNVNLSDNELTKLPLKFRNISGYFSCENNKLTSLEGGPQTVGDDFYCHSNQLTSLEGGPQSVGGDFSCFGNQLVNLNGFPEYFESEAYLSNNPVVEIYNLFRTVKCINWLNEFDVIQGNKVIMDRLEEVYHQLNMEMPENIKFKSYEII